MPPGSESKKLWSAMAAVKKSHKKQSVAKHAVIASKRKIDAVYKDTSHKSLSPTKTGNLLHVQQLPTLPQKRTLLSFKKPKMHAEAVKQLTLEKQKSSDSTRTFKSQSSSNNLSKKLNMGVRKTGTRPQTARKTKSLPSSHGKKVSHKIQRQSLPNNIMKKRTSMLAKGKTVSKRQKHSLELSDSSDDDILYSLAVPWHDRKSVSNANNNNSVGAKKCKLLGRVEGNSKREMSDDVDSEISFPHQRKDLNKQKRKTTVEPGLFSMVSI